MNEMLTVFGMLFGFCVWPIIGLWGIWKMFGLRLPDVMSVPKEEESSTPFPGTLVFPPENDPLRESFKPKDQ